MPATPPTPAPTRLRQPQAIDDMLLFRLSRLLAVGGAAVVRLCEGRYGITRREWAVLSLLWQQQGLGPSELADRVQLDRARTSKALGQLLAKQLVRREPRPGDHRRALLWLTPAGEALVSELMPQVRQLNEQLLQVLSTAEVDALDQSLARLQQQALALNQAQEPGSPKADRRLGRRRV
ncbi:MarR family winged helix-turn-helix transcriptional regulator [Curvibacter gracilis]|uniref:MarR family winged helix-turn-helix transcriptional regulator n=1 Tax=Curvibacter gracilis TaxID=230310 RepID=UPI000486A7E8|nr:MarR family transcriptional regulator [Curvibacter gracilis]